MITRQKLKNHFLTMLFLSIVFFVSAYLILNSAKKYYSPSEITARLNSEILFSLSDLDKEIDIITSAGFDNEATLWNFINTNNKNSFKERGVEILVYENDSLKYWTNNVFAAPVYLDSLSFGYDIVISGSGYYLVKSRKTGPYTIVALQLLRYNYKYSNEYLPSGFYKRFSAPSNVGILFEPGKNNITSSEGKFLCNLSFDEPFELQIWLQYLIFTLYVTSFLCFVATIFGAYLFVIRNIGKKKIMFLFFIIDVLILRAIQFYFKFPAGLFESDLFNPAYFA